MALTPVIISIVAGNEVVETGSIDPLDGTRLLYTINRGGGTIEGWYVVDGPLAGWHGFTPSGTFTEAVTVIERSTPTGAARKRYEARPEDELEFNYAWQLEDSYPWLRPILAGGEIAPLECGDASNAADNTLQPVLWVQDETGKNLELLGVEYGPHDRGYAVLGPISNPNFLGQSAHAFNPTETLTEISGHSLHTGPLAAILNTTGPTNFSQQLGTTYRVSSIRGQLVADGPAHWTPAHYTGLACWLTLTEHPLQPYVPVDRSDFAPTAAELERGAFTSSYSTSDRQWDNDRGWTLRLRASANPGQLTIAKTRWTGLAGTVSFWLKTSAAAPTASGSWPVLSYGPIQFKLNVDASSNQTLTAELKRPDGTWQTLGSVNVAATVASFYHVAVDPLPADLQALEIHAVSTGPVADLIGLPTINGAALTAGQVILLTGQLDPTENGSYLISEQAWSRLHEVLTYLDEAQAYYRLAEGHPQAGSIWQCANTGTITYGTTELTYAVVNCAATYNGAMANAYAAEFGRQAEILAIQAPPLTGAPDTYFGDIRLWSVAKTSAELALIEAPAFKPVKTAAGPAYFTTSTGALRVLQVLPSGYVFPNVTPVDFHAESLRRGVRYNARGEYVGPDHRLQTGLGDAPAQPASVTLGLQGPGTGSHGRGIAASTSSNVPGFNEAWYSDTAANQYRRLTTPGGPDPDVDNTALVASPASDYHPAETPNQNPNQARIYVVGEDNLLYRVAVHVERSGITDTPELFAKLAFQCTGDSSTALPWRYLSSDSDDIFEVLKGAIFYDLIVNNASVAADLGDFISDAHTVLSRAGVGRLAVETVGGEPQVTFIADAGATIDTAPIYLYTQAQNYLRYQMPADLAYWRNPADLDEDELYNLPAREAIGPLILTGTDAQIDPGTYQVALDVTNQFDERDFPGFDVEVSLVSFSASGQQQSNATQPATLLPRGTATFQAQYTYGADVLRAQPRLANCLPILDSSATGYNTTLQAALNELEELTGGLEVLQIDPDYPSVPGGPYWIRFTTTGAKPLLQFVTTRGLEVAVTREVPGDGSTQEIQKIVFGRPVTLVELTVTDTMSVTGGSYWTLQIYLTNPRIGYRRLLLHEARLYRISPQIYKIDLDGGGLDITRVSITDGTDTPSTKPGGFRVTYADDGNGQYTSEQSIQAKSSLPGDAASESDLAAIHLLTGSTGERTSSLQLSTTYQLTDPTPPAWPPTVDITVSTYAAEIPDPNNPQLQVIASA